MKNPKIIFLNFSKFPFALAKSENAIAMCEPPFIYKPTIFIKMDVMQGGAKKMNRKER